MHEKQKKQKPELHVPNMSHNLISITKLTQDQKSQATFITSNPSYWSRDKNQTGDAKECMQDGNNYIRGQQSASLALHCI